MLKERNGLDHFTTLVERCDGSDGRAVASYPVTQGSNLGTGSEDYK